MRIIKDNINNAQRVISEVILLEEALSKAAKACQLYRGSVRVEYKSLSQFLVASRKELMGLPLKDFSVRYPALQAMVENCTAMDAGMKRLNSCIFNLGLLVQMLEKTNNMPKTDDDRGQCLKYAQAALADLVVFTIIQFKLSDTDEGVMLSVHSWCEDNNISVDVFYGIQLDMLKETGNGIYGYESVSPYYDDLMALDSNLMGECEEADFPLTEDLCRRLLDGELLSGDISIMLADFIKGQQTDERKDITPTNIFQKMHLD